MDSIVAVTKRQAKGIATGDKEVPAYTVIFISEYIMVNTRR